MRDEIAEALAVGRVPTARNARTGEVATFRNGAWWTADGRRLAPDGKPVGSAPETVG